MVTLATFLDALVEGGLYTAAGGWVGTPALLHASGAAGRRLAAGREAVTAGTRFDLASLTKPFMASLALCLDASGLLPLGLTVGEIWSRGGPGGPVPHRQLAGRRLEDLLRHRSGLRAWAPLADRGVHRCQNRREVLARLLSGELLGARAGTYSDLGYILWGLAAEERLGLPLSELLRAHLLAPLGLAGVGPSPGPCPDIAACLLDTGKEVELAAAQGVDLALVAPPAIGEVQDGNARFLRRLGVPLTAHAGLFGGIGDLARLAAEWLRPGSVLPPAGVARALAGSGRRLLGWERRRYRGSGGAALSPGAFGHTGFTGGSVWIDPRDEAIFVLLGHRASPHSDLTPVRRRFHRLGTRTLVGGGQQC